MRHRLDPDTMTPAARRDVRGAGLRLPGSYSLATMSPEAKMTGILSGHRMDVKTLVANLIRVADLAGVTILPEAIAVEVLPAPHRPPVLPAGKMRVYIFQWGDECLEVGEVGPRFGLNRQSPTFRALAQSLQGIPRARAEPDRQETL